MRNISCSGRKECFISIKSWLDMHTSYAKLHGDLNFNYEDIDYVFGMIGSYPEHALWGGRIANSFNLDGIDLYWMYDHGIGLKLPFSTRSFNDEMYNQSLTCLRMYHQKGNAIITSLDKLAKRIKEDFPKYKIEASCIQDIVDIPRLEKKISLGLYDTIVLPIHMNDDIKFLKNIKDKEKIRLFLNVECSYTCPKKICYGTTSKINAGKRDVDKMLCSKFDLDLPRTFYKDEINWSEFYFDKLKFDKMGFSKYKLLPPWEQQQRTMLMYKTEEAWVNRPFGKIINA